MVKLRPECFSPLTRFSNKASDYVKYRPSYPVEVISEIVNKKLGINESSEIADIGSGTGKFSELLLKHTKAKKVFCVEPNKEMREAAEYLLSEGNKGRFVSVNGTGESTTLKDNSLDLVTSAQAFHWFNLTKAKSEMSRILKPSGNLLILWNLRKDITPLLQSYDKLMMKYCKNYNELYVKTIEKEDLDILFEKEYEEISFPYKQEFDLDGLQGRLKSSSFCPEKNTKEFELIMSELRELFKIHQKNGKVEYVYETICYFGKPFLNKL